MRAPLPDLKPHYPPTPTPVPPALQQTEPASIKTTIQTLNLTAHIEGGYFTETDRHPHRLTTPSPNDPESADRSPRALSSTIHYLLTPTSPVGVFHLNRSRTIHTLHYGRARYVVIKADRVAAAGQGGKAGVESFVVGPDVASGERISWVVPGGVWKGCFLLPPGGGEDRGLLISETVVPGFEYADHEFLRLGKMEELLRPEDVAELRWMLKKVD